MITPDQLRKCAACVYLSADEGPADDIARHLNQAAETIQTLQARNSELEERLKEAEDLAREVCRRLKEPSDTHEESELRKQARAFLNPPRQGRGRVMPHIEMPQDIAEELADLLGIYNSAESHLEDCKCRVCFVIGITDRIRESVANEKRWQSNPTPGDPK